MNILITGAQGFVGRNFAVSLERLRDDKEWIQHIADANGAKGNPSSLQIFLYDINSTRQELEAYCRDADYVFNLAGVNRPKDQSEFMKGNFGFSSILLDTLKKYHNACPVVLASSVQASLEGRFAGSEYGKSKLAGEKLFQSYARETGAKVLVYRFPNLFGKWCRPNYNSAVATFCSNIANGLPIQVNDRSTVLDLVYIDDLVAEFLCALNGGEHRDANGYCYVPQIYHETLGKIVDLLYEFKESREKRTVPDMTEGSFSKKLYAAYLSYLSPGDFSYKLTMNVDNRGSFTEVFRTWERGQFSVNISKPGITKGQHWHHTKNEKFVVVSGTGLIRLRKIGTDPDTGKTYPVIEYPVSGEEIKVVEMIPGYTHNITNTSPTEDLVTLIWCSECFDPGHPDTFFEEV